jgi:uncharacterized membrane protein YdbT with pleckstrin-like domain
MIKDMFDPGEDLIWEGKPDRLAYIIGKPLYYLIMLIMLAGYVFLSYMLTKQVGSTIDMKTEVNFAITVVVFIYVIMPIYRAINWRYVKYAVTTKRVYFTSGIIGRDINVLDYTAVSSPEVNVGFIDKLRNCGTVRLNPKNRSEMKMAASKVAFEHIPDAYNVYKMIKQLSLDIKSDIYYPNALRPEENEGYNTKYTPKQ